MGIQKPMAAWRSVRARVALEQLDQDLEHLHLGPAPEALTTALRTYYAGGGRPVALAPIAGLARWLTLCARQYQLPVIDDWHTSTRSAERWVRAGNLLRGRAARAHAERVVEALRDAEFEQLRTGQKHLQELGRLVLIIATRYAEGRFGRLLDGRDLPPAAPLPCSVLTDILFRWSR